MWRPLKYQRKGHSRKVWTQLTGPSVTSHMQVSKLYEELECQISGERSKVALEHSQKEARALASLENEVRKTYTVFGCFKTIWIALYTPFMSEYFYQQ